MINDKISNVIDNIKRNWEEPNVMENMEKSEKIVSIGAGAFIFLKGISNLISHPFLAVVEVAIGGGLLYRGLTGYCPVKDITENNIGDDLYVKESYLDRTSPI